MERDLVISYARLSRAKENGELSIKVQHSANARAAENNGETVNLFLEDVGFTGASDKRPSFQKIVTMIKEGRVKALYFHRFDRLYRNSSLQSQFEVIASKTNTKLISSSEPYNGNQPEAKLIRGVVALINESLIDVYAEQTMKVLLDKARRGEYTGGTIPFGFCLKDKYLVADAKEGSIVRYMFTRVADGVDINTVLRELDSRGYMTRRGKSFTRTNLYDILHNPVYMGLRVFNRRAKGTRDGKRNSHKMKPEEDWVVAKGEALVTAELFATVQRRLCGQSTLKATAHKAYPLTGLLRCGLDTDKSHLVGEARRGIRYYRCCMRSNHRMCDLKDVNADALESVIWDILVHFFAQKKMLTGLTRCINVLAFKQLSYKEETATLYAALRNKEEALKNLLDVLEKSTVESGSVVKRITMLEEDIGFIKDEIAKVTKAAKTPVYTEDDVRDALCSLPKTAAMLKYVGETRIMLSVYIKNITVTNETVEIDLV